MELDHRPAKPIGFALSVCVAMALGLWLVDNFTAGQGFWKMLPVCEKTECFFCETPRFNNFVRQPANTFSNLGFLFLGAYMIFVGFWDKKRKHPRNTLEADPVWSFAYGIACIFLFFGSSLFHASLTDPMEYLDLAGVYLFAFFPVFFNWRWIIAVHRGRKRLARTRLVLVFWFFFSVGLAALMHLLPVHIIILMAVLSVAGSLIYLEWRFPRRTKRIWLVLSMSCIFGAMAFFVMDESRMFCDPYHWFQPHAAWHLMATATGLFYFRYLRSERR
jgi:hypothetical protein